MAHYPGEDLIAVELSLCLASKETRHLQTFKEIPYSLVAGHIRSESSPIRRNIINLGVASHRILRDVLLKAVFDEQFIRRHQYDLFETSSAFKRVEIVSNVRVEKSGIPFRFV